MPNIPPKPATRARPNSHLSQRGNRLGPPPRQKQEKPASTDLEGHYYQLLQESYFESDIQSQLFFIKALSDVQLAKQNYTASMHLLNAAIQIETDNEESQQLLYTLGNIELMVLTELCGKEIYFTDIVPIKNRRAQLAEIRNSTQLRLASEYSIVDLQSDLTARLQKFLMNLVYESIDHLGPPPCSYALVGLGSMSSERDVSLFRC